MSLTAQCREDLSLVAIQRKHASAAHQIDAIELPIETERALPERCLRVDTGDAEMDRSLTGYLPV